MAANFTYVPIATTTLASAAASYTFSSIPGTYKDLVLVANLQLVSGTGSGTIRVNGDSGTNYSVTSMYGDGTVNAYRNSNVNVMYFSLSTIPNTGTFEVATLHFQNYANTTTYKTILARVGNQRTTGGATEACVGLWRSTSAITSIEVRNDGGVNFAAGCSLTLYGIAGA